MTGKRRSVIVLLGCVCLTVCIGAVAQRHVFSGETEVAIEDVPANVLAAIQAQSQGGTIQEIEMESLDGQVVYEADVLINGQEVEIQVSTSGEFIGKEIEDEDEDGEDDDDADDDLDEESDDEEDGDDVQVSAEDLPAAVLATLNEVAPDAEIKELELETEDGRKQYAIDAAIDGQLFDIEIAPDGTLLQKELETEDDD